MPEVVFVASADVGVPSRRRLADICTAAGKAEPKEFDDYRDMLATCRDEMDAVYVSTPHAFHAEQAIAVVEAGLDLFLEKPMVTTVPEAEAWLRRSERAARPSSLPSRAGCHRWCSIRSAARAPANSAISSMSARRSWRAGGQL